MARCCHGSFLYLLPSGPRQRLVLLRGWPPNKVLLRGPPQGHPGSRYELHQVDAKNRERRNEGRM